jgi:hypothetical protein
MKAFHSLTIMAIVYALFKYHIKLALGSPANTIAIRWSHVKSGLVSSMNGIPAQKTASEPLGLRTECRVTVMNVEEQRLEPETRGYQSIPFIYLYSST